MIAFILVIVGGLNWGLVGIGGWNVVNKIFGSVSWLERLVYILVGISALVLIFTHKRDCKCCAKGAGQAM
jgi:uncharacterized membrane protein YuzA (DUF378 family)